MTLNSSGWSWRLISSPVVDILNPLFLISLALFVGIGYILTLLTPVAIGHWQALFWVSLLVPAAVLASSARAKWTETEYRAPSWRSLLPLVPLLVILPAVWAEFTSPTLQVTHHGDIHIGYIHQLLYETTPIDNVFMVGFPANYYWLYHAYLATIAQITGFSPASASSIVNVAAIFSSLLWIGQTLQLLKFGKSGTLTLGFMILLVYFSVNLTSTLTLLGHYFSGTYRPYAFDLMRLPGADLRLHSVMGKVMNFTSVTLGIMTFTAALYACVRLAKGKISISALVIVSAAGVAALAVREIAALYIVIVLLGSLAVFVAHDWVRDPYKTNWIKQRWRALAAEVSPPALLIWLTISLALSAPLVKYNLDIVGSFSAGRPFGLSFANVQTIVTALLLLLPLFLLQFVFLWRGRDRGQTYIQLCALIALLPATFLTLPDSNQYKGVYFLGMLMALSALFALRTMRQQESMSWRHAGRAAAALLYVLVLTQVIYVSASNVRRAEIYAEQGYSFNGIHLEYVDDVDGRLPAYVWIREHTPANAVVLLPIIPSKYSNLFHERMLYVRLLQLHFKSSLLAYNERARDLELIYSEETEAAEFRALIEDMERELPDRSFYAVVKGSEVRPEVMRGRGAEMVYEHEADGGNVFLLNPRSAG
ncbi:MAG: hypothetical protein OXE52_15020 [Chloroflexi bacterium]|nr:hypothetical protein [Chloroflexota bacterium]